MTPNSENQWLSINHWRKMCGHDILFSVSDLVVKLSFEAQTDGSFLEAVCRI